jgi:hypothetical protein
MSGLFRRARALRTRMELLGELQNDDFVLEMPDDEKESVLSGIDSMLKDDHIRMDEGALRFIPKKRSFVLPLMLNVGAVVVLGIGGVILWNIFDRNETALVNPDVNLISAEGRILDRLRQDAEAELGQKDREIADVRSLLLDLENQKSLLAVETESQIAARENELRKEFDAALAAERVRLSETGVSGGDLTIALAAYETEVRDSFNAELAEARRVATAEQERRIAELDAQRNLYENQIAAADGERVLLQDELEARNTEIQVLEQAKIDESSEAARQLVNLRAVQEQEKNITAQILAFYSRVGDARLAGDSDSALLALDSLEAYLNEDGIRGSAVVNNRREIDGFLTQALRRLILLESSGETAVVDDGSAELLADLAAGAAAGTQLAESGNIEGARDVWRNAFSAMPELEAAFDEALASADTGDGKTAGGLLGGVAAGVTAAELAGARGEGFTEGLQQGRAAAESASAADLDAAKQSGLEDGLEQGRTTALSDIDERLGAAEERGFSAGLASLASRISDLQDRYRNALDKNDEEKNNGRDRLVNLLDQKLVIKSELDASQQDRLEEYTEATGDLREVQGREAVYNEIISFLSGVLEAGKEEAAVQ